MIRCKGFTMKGKQCTKQSKTHEYCCIHKDMYKYERPSECVICSETLLESIRPTRCGHFMHPECLNKWLETNENCPVCRTQLIEMESSNELSFSLLINSNQGNSDNNLQVQELLQHFVDFIRLQSRIEQQ